MSSFETLPNRENTRSVKWDRRKDVFGSESVHPMWVADMDLEIADPIKQALVERVHHGVFGYTLPDAALNQLIVNWIDKQHDWKVDTESIIYSPGVLQTIHMAILTQTEPGDRVLIQTPVYPPFHSIVENHGRELVKHSLVLENGRYTIDFNGLEEMFKTGIKAMIFCSPHNPVGRVWTRDELEQLLKLAHDYNVLIISDDIHADITFDEHQHLPLGKLAPQMSDQLITCLSPTKTFNLAGLQVSYAVIEDKAMRETIQEAFKRYGVMMLNTLGLTALESAYQEGDKWLEDLRELLHTNRKLVEEAFQDRSDINVLRAEGTYLLWLDCRNMNLTQEELKRFMEKEAKVGLNNGTTFGDEGEGFMRLNIASPTHFIKEGLDKIIHALNHK
ncbi:cystathione beta-lyase [Pelagirhabdus alkalitolerans]|uniref:cysteine-S-conjugate beta-lyase n=1 Tax=Pelagirhabdus alkalitolerans TaxID=1612202 RepID=A0A1G6LU67_9BACI|nr:PatB family C-S lyase [Pelagirhabdus alkalitolerans]SDC46812.1 cystathione beta-lyase [Pelagirhabdus alkalitolerans]